MALDQAKEFIKKIGEDEALAKKLEEAKAAYTGDKAESLDAVVIPIAKEAGFEFTAEEFKTAVAEAEKQVAEAEKQEESEELSEDQLEAVAGGGFFSSLFKVVKTGVKIAKWFL